MIKSTTDNAPSLQEPSFPCLMKHYTHNIIVLFRSDKNGVVVNTDDSTYPIGYHSTTWAGINTHHWVRFNGTVSLSNV